MILVIEYMVEFLLHVRLFSTYVKELVQNIFAFLYIAFLKIHHFHSQS